LLRCKVALSDNFAFLLESSIILQVNTLLCGFLVVAIHLNFIRMGFQEAELECMLSPEIDVFDGAPEIPYMSTQERKTCLRARNILFVVHLAILGTWLSIAGSMLGRGSCMGRNAYCKIPFVF
jgi:hypothetical protein